MGQGFQLRETASFLNGLPPEVFGKFSGLKILHISFSGLWSGSMTPVLRI
jgi:hypothetical protein